MLCPETNLLGDDFFLKTFDVSYSYIYQKRFDRTEVYASSYALDYLKHKLVATFDFKILNNLYADVVLNVHNRKGGFVKYEPVINEDNTTGYNAVFTKYKSFALLSCKLKWKKDKYELFLHVDNITDVGYYDIGNVLQPGIWTMVGAKFMF